MAKPNPASPMEVGMSVIDSIKKQAAQARENADREKAAKSNGPGTPSIPDPLSQLAQQIQNINIAPTPYEQLLQQATGTAGAQFDPLIQQLAAEIQATEKRGNRNKREARNMYGGLSNDIVAQLPEITNRMAQASRDTETRYDQTQQALQGQYNQQAQNQAAILKRLGIQAAAPEASQQAMEDQAYFMNQSQTEEDAALSLLNEMKQADVSYNKESANNARLAGENVAQDISSQLEQYLQIAQGKLGGLQAGRESAIQGMLAQLQGQDAQRIQSQEQQEYQRLMDMFNLQLKMQEMQMKYNNNGQESLFKGTNGPSGAANYLTEVYGPNDVFTSKSIMDAINDVVSTPEVEAGKYQDPEMTDQYGNPIMNKMTMQRMIGLLRQRLMEGDLDPNTPADQLATSYSEADINHAINALMAMRGQLR